MSSIPPTIQVAFQGGGARLALLLPVVHALRDLEEAGTLVISRVAGTSAGAMAAALVAGQANMAALLEHLRGLEDGTLEKAFPALDKARLHRKLRLLGRLFLRNRPLASDAPLADLLARAFKASGIARSAT
jgi:predicted acylesterase/phospholipase RssA